MNLLIGPTTNYNNLELFNKYDAIQITLDDPADSNYKKNYETFKNICQEVFIHSKYTYNISKQNINHPIKTESNYLRSINRRNGGIVIHLSKYYLETRNEALIDVAVKLNELCNKYLIDSEIKILLETTNNIGHLGSNINDFYVIFKNLNNLAKQHVGICLDTSHLFLSGVDLSDPHECLTYFFEFEKTIGLEKIKLIHLNDINSVLFGKHTPHLAVSNAEGKIFQKNILSLELILHIASITKAPLILERNREISKDEIDKEIDFIKSLKMVLTDEEVKLLLKNMLIVDLIEIKQKYSNNQNDIKLLEEIKNLLIKSYDESNKKLYNNFKTSLKDNVFDNLLFDDPNYLTVSKDLKDALNNYSLSIFQNYTDSEIQKSIEELTKIKFIGEETARRLLDLDITTIKDLISTSKEFKKKHLSEQQIKALAAFKFIKTPLNYETALLIEDSFKRIRNYEIYVLGSFFRKEKTLNDLDILVIGNCADLAKVITQIEDSNFFLKKGVLLDGDKRKMYVFNFKTKNKNNFFIADFYQAEENEKLFMKVFLKNTKIGNIVLRKRAIKKGFSLSNKQMINIKTKEHKYFKNEKELYDFLETNPTYHIDAGVAL